VRKKLELLKDLRFMVIEGIIKKDEERFLKPLMKVKDFKNE
jgi:hypothetical protein